jgi:WD40 repeat protein
VAGFPEFGFQELGRGESATSPDGSRLLVSPGHLDLTKKKDKESEPRVIRLFEIPSGKLVATWPVPMSPEETMVSISRLGSGGRRTLSMHVPLAAILSGKVNPLDIQLWVRDLTTGEFLLRFQDRSMADGANDFSADNRLLAVGAEQGYVDLWDVDAKERLFRWQPHGGKKVQQLTIAPDGDIATVAESEDRLVVLCMAKVRAKLTELGLGW